MKLLFVAIFLFTCSLGFGQEKKTKKTYSNLYIETYTIYKADKKKDGQYVKIRKSNKDTLVVGAYKNDIQSGLWTYKASNIKDYLVYDYDNDSMIIHNVAKSDSFFVKVDNAFVFTNIDSPPVYIGYEDEISYLLANNLSVSLRLMEAGVSGYTQAYMIINKLGKLENVGIEKSLDADMDKNILKTIQLIDGQWIPAKRNGQPVDTKIYVLVNVTPEIPYCQIKQQPYLLIVDLVYYGVEKKYNSATTTIQGVKSSRD